MGFDVTQILGFLGPIGLLGLFLLFMIMRKGWGWAQFVTAFIFTLLVASALPALPQAMHNGTVGVINAFQSK